MLLVMATVQFWFDPICPWTYVTYQWLVEAASVRSLKIRPRLLSLYFLNRDRPDTGHRASHEASRQLERFLAWVRAEHGDRLMEQAYDRLGQELFLNGRQPDAELVRTVATELGLSTAEAANAASDENWETVILEDHQVAMALVGDDVGSPVIALADGAAFFGPVFSRAPKGAAAGQVWDGCVALASHPDFFELKRSRPGSVGPVFT